MQFQCIYDEGDTIGIEVGVRCVSVRGSVYVYMCIYIQHVLLNCLYFLLCKLSLYCTFINKHTSSTQVRCHHTYVHYFSFRICVGVCVSLLFVPSLQEEA